MLLLNSKIKYLLLQGTVGKVKKIHCPFAALHPKMDIRLKDVSCQHWVGFLQVTTCVMARASLIADRLTCVKWTLSLWL